MLLSAGGALAPLSGCSGAAAAGAPTTVTPASAAAIAALPAPEPILHLLRRTRFGTSAKDLAAARAQGIDGYLETQLAPQRLPDAAELERLLRYPLTQLPPLLVAQLGRAELLAATQQLAEMTAFLATYSERQLFEVMVDFWNDHFNVENVTGLLPQAKILYDRLVIRAHALGSFRNLLHATAKSAAMIEYLDGRSNRVGGPNENYARELMELHTLGHGGGYDEHDVREVARCFTGWSFGALNLQFVFRGEDHDRGEKTVLGELIPAGGGVSDGERVLDLLAAHPSTARFVAGKLVRRFVADDPPALLVDAVAAEFMRSDGHIPSLLRVLFTHPAFYDYADAKLKRPLDFVCGAVRAFDDNSAHFGGGETIELLGRMGQIPHRWFPPDGYPDRAEYWLSTSGLLERWNFAATLVETRGLLGRSLATRHLASSETPESLVDRLAERLVQRPLRETDRRALIEVAGAAGAALSGEALTRAAERVAGLLLASPAFNLR